MDPRVLRDSSSQGSPFKHTSHEMHPPRSVPCARHSAWLPAMARPTFDDWMSSSSPCWTEHLYILTLLPLQLTGSQWLMRSGVNLVAITVSTSNVWRLRGKSWGPSSKSVPAVEWVMEESIFTDRGFLRLSEPEPMSWPQMTTSVNCPCSVFRELKHTMFQRQLSNGCCA